MKQLLVLAWLGLAPLSLADDNNLIQNGDFSSGIAHWEGDHATIEAASSSGALVKLGSAWSKIIQNFSAKMGDYVLTVKYALLPDLRFSTNPEDYGRVSTLLALPNVGAFGARTGQWCVVVFDTSTGHSTFWRITPSRGSAGQTFTCRIHLDSDNDQEGKTLVLAFPPGNGSIHLQSVSLTPATSSIVH
ncbi:MAG: hypothetical protein LV480_14815 [Methylacidiphilales bacterium]|nr:hypothetical protein [Candidatus Methylacidiphilales bacterium]